MRFPTRRLRLVIFILVAGGLLSYRLPFYKPSSAQGLTPVPISSSPIVLDRAEQFLWAVNPDNDSVSVIDIRNDAHIKVNEINVGDEPQSIAISKDNTKVY